MLERPFDVERDQPKISISTNSESRHARSSIGIIVPGNPEQWQAAGVMARELIAWIAERAPVDPESVIEPMLRESQRLDIAFEPPRACFLMALANSTRDDGLIESVPAGITAVRLIEPGIAELKRVWVRPQFRDRGIASMLLDLAIEKARAMLAHTMRLETAPAIMPRAHAMYLARGFRVIEPYSGLPQHAPDVVAMELPLTM